MAGEFDSLQTLSTDVAKLFGSWQDRLRPTCKMTSPSGIIFNPLWSGSSRNFDKKIGRFNFPGVKGTYLQDLEVNGDSYPMTVSFEGKNNDIDAELFFAACKERGKWLIVHPVHGDLALQLISVTQNDDPTGSGNITTFDLNFEESISLIAPVQSVASSIHNQVELANSASALQFADAAILDTFSSINSIVNTAKIAKIIITSVLEPLRTLNEEIDNLFNQISQSIDNTLDAIILEPLVLAGQFQQLLQIPALIQMDVVSKINMYENIIDQLFSEPVKTVNDISRNKIAVYEIISNACFVSICSSITSGNIISRSEAREINEMIYSIFISMTQKLDDVQILFRGQLAYKQYFSQTSSFSELAKIFSFSLQYVNSVLFDLSVERKFILKKFWNTWLLAATEYGGPGESDSNVDYFIQTNNLHGTDILFLPPGREVVAYG